MAQLTGTTRRSASHTPAFVAGTLLAIAVMATGIVLALALGNGFRDEVTVAQPAAIVPGVSVYDGSLDPTEAAYLHRSQPGAHGAPALAPVVSIYDGRLDPIEAAYIRQVPATPRDLPERPSDATSSRGGISRYHLVPR